MQEPGEHEGGRGCRVFCRDLVERLRRLRAAVVERLHSLECMDERPFTLTWQSRFAYLIAFLGQPPVLR
jgi:hypothetical protein